MSSGNIIYFFIVHIISFIFWQIPFIVKLILNKKAHFVAQIEEFIRSRIVSCPDSITTSSFKYGKTTFPYIFRNGSSYDTSIMMQTYTFYFHILSIKEKTFVLIKMYSPYSKSGLAISYRFIATNYICFSDIEIWRIYIPKFGIE